MMIVGAILCFIVGPLTNPIDFQTIYLGIVLVIVVLSTGFFAWWQERKSDSVMAGFKALTPARCNVMRDGQVIEMDAKELVKGDICLVNFGEKVPADCRILEAVNLKVDNSSLTGEPEPLRRVPEQTDDSPFETKNLAFYGTFFTEGSGKVVVYATGDRTFLGNIASSTLNTVKNQSTLNIEIHHFIKIMATIAISLGVVFFIIAITVVQYPILDALIFAIGIIVANVPEGLLPQLTVALTLTAVKMKDINVLVKNLETIETLGSTTCIASDKTGTLTMNKMTASHCYYNGTIHNTGGDNPVSGATYTKFEKDDEQFKRLQRVATVCNKTTFVFEAGETPDIKQIQNWKCLGDASESALVKFCHPLRDIIEFRSALKQVAAIPFNSVNKWQLSVHEDREKNCNVVLMKGAPEKIAALCEHVWINGQKVGININEIEERNLELGGRGERVLAFAELELPVDKFPLGFAFDTENKVPNFPITNLTFCGLISLIDPPRPGVPEAVLTCQEAGIKVIMVTGDHPVTARAIARSVNIMPGKTAEELAKERGIPVDAILNDKDEKEKVECVVTPGHLLPHLTDDDWRYILSRKYIVFARTLPQQKQDIVGHLQSELGGHHLVAVTGDGVNDSPALKKADTGIAMGIAGSDVAKEAADIILMDDNFASIVKGIAEGRLIFDNLQKCIVYVLSSNVPEIIPFLVFIAGRIPLALEIVMILAIDLGTDLAPAICLAYELAESDLMKRKPRNSKTDRLTNLQLFFLGYGILGVLETLIGYWCFFGVFDSFGFFHSDLTGAAIDFKKENTELCGKSCCSQWYAAFPTVVAGTATAAQSAMAQQEMCKYPACLKENERLQFFCGLMDKNSYWKEHGLSHIKKGHSFAHFRHDVFRQAQSAFLFSIAIAQIGCGLCVKSHIQSIFECGIKNKYLVYSIISEIVLMVLICYCPGIQDIFGTTAFDGKWIGIAIIVIPVMLAVEETRKWFARNYPAKLRGVDSKGEIFYSPNPHPLAIIAKATQY